MVDIETLGLAPGSIILTLAAVEFTASEHSILFDASIAVGASLKAGLTIEPGIVAWHIDHGTFRSWQRREAYADLRDALDQLFARLTHEDVLWANSPNFDIVMIEAAARRVDLQWPWSHRNLRDLRTALAGRPDFDPATVPFAGTPHDPADDCRHQIELLRASGHPL